jgi:outer membrane receptor protein involved in Fe transport
VQLNLQGAAAVGKIYKVGQQFGTLEFGAKIRDGHKDNNTNSPKYTVKKGVIIPAGQFPGSFPDPNYYEGSYPWPTLNADYPQIESYVAAHPDQFTFTGGPGPNKNSYDLTERVAAGYVMNSMDLGARVRLVAGVRVESTHVDTRSFQASTGLQDYKAGGDYTDVLPSVSLKVATADNAAIRLVYSRALSRPNPGDISKAVGIPNITNPPTVSLQSRSEGRTCEQLATSHLSNIKPLGMVQAGYSTNR